MSAEPQQPPPTDDPLPKHVPLELVQLAKEGKLQLDDEFKAMFVLLEAKGINLAGVITDANALCARLECVVLNNAEAARAAAKSATAAAEKQSLSILRDIQVALAEGAEAAEKHRVERDGLLTQRIEAVVAARIAAMPPPPQIDIDALAARLAKSVSVSIAPTPVAPTHQRRRMPMFLGVLLGSVLTAVAALVVARYAPTAWDAALSWLERVASQLPA